MALKVTGLREMERKLRAVRAMPGWVLEDAVEAGGKPIEKDARRRAPRGDDSSPRLAENIETFPQQLSRTRAEAEVGPTTLTFYGIFQELGTRYHNAQPFLRPAADTQRPAALAAMGVLVGEWIEHRARVG